MKKNYVGVEICFKELIETDILSLSLLGNDNDGFDVTGWEIPEV